MARDEVVERRLRVWAQWLMVGDGSGYPSMSTLHPDWSPPSPGTTPTMKVGASSSARETHRLVGLLSERLQATLLLHYCTNLPVAEQALRLGCQADTVHKRVQVAHKLLQGVLRNTDSGYISGTLRQVSPT